MKEDLMIKTSAIKILLLMVLFVLAADRVAVAQKDINHYFPALIPLPVDFKQANGVFNIGHTTKIICNDKAVLPAAELLVFYIQSISGKQPAFTSATANRDVIVLQLDTTKVMRAEGYHLTVTTDKIDLVAHDPAGIVYGIQTLRQLWNTNDNISLNVPACVINDFPRFAYRGMSLDVSRHMFPVSFIKKYIDLLSLYKLNVFHWHLTDDQGWRIEIKNYPGLQSVAAWRKETLVGHKKKSPHLFDGKKYGGYYTREEAKDIVQYAALRNITVIPEIEMPGHAMAALAAYPHLGCTGGPYQTATFWGVFDDVYCAGNDSVFIFLQQVLDEIMDIFPSKKIHIGGDECPKIRWKECPKCQLRIRQLGLQNEHDLQSYFIQRIEKYINNKGRQIIGWDEILEGGLAPNATVMSWRGETGGIAAARQKHTVIMTPESHLYFDYYQSLYPDEPVAAGGFTPLSKVYGYEPAADSVDAETKSYITGIEGQGWSEYFTNTTKAEYMLFPRILALAEIAWTTPAQRDYQNFLKRLRGQYVLLQQSDVNYAKNTDEINCTTVTQKRSIVIKLESTFPGAQIRYTTDGKIPGAKSLLYKTPLSIDKSCTVKAWLAGNKNQHARIFEQSFHLHKAIGASVNLVNAPIARFSTDASTLVNGMAGNDKYNDMQWMGFSGNNMEATIDLGSVQKIHSIAMNFLNYHWQKMWAPKMLEIFVSPNGHDYKKVFEQHVFNRDGINKVQVKIKGMLSRYIKVIGINKGMIPAGKYGAGSNALLMIDEIMID